MDFSDIAARGLVLLGCGRMGSAMLDGWLKGGLPADSVWVKDPNPSDWLEGQGVHINADLPEKPAIVVIAVKPQMMGEALPSITGLDDGSTLFISVAAGTLLERFQEVLGVGAPIVRAMPNTPAAIGQGITALIGSETVTPAQLDQAEGLLRAVGETVRLDSESQMDAVTGVSGSGPAYVFLMIEAMAAAGVAQGLAPELAMRLAKATMAGAGQLALPEDADPGQLRVNVTSPAGTTAAALDVLMNDLDGLPPLMAKAVAAAAARSKELSRG
ncbi:pyrroline-5-carboxylate reductase [Chachezhania antarctica]|uniref:pyrroline-5-carboxylate reductase n=1 Tax=Chachezhania antarctica TaxID=2340860 RepID=UPI000EB244C4|nr:pyrroline-5-carboxylate reductase [Chachezhania antarctica]|tara:strand:- start:320 stop:1135 length:816 start_codon:yes stop_codon:yes gene_type:complete